MFGSLISGSIFGFGTTGNKIWVICLRLKKHIQRACHTVIHENVSHSENFQPRNLDTRLSTAKEVSMPLKVSLVLMTTAAAPQLKESSTEVRKSL